MNYDTPSRLTSNVTFFVFGTGSKWGISHCVVETNAGLVLDLKLAAISFCDTFWYSSHSQKQSPIQLFLSVTVTGVI